MHERFFSSHEFFLTKNAPKFSPKFLSLCSVGQTKSRENSLQISHQNFQISLRKIKKNSPTSFCRSAGRTSRVQLSSEKSQHLSRVGGKEGGPQKRGPGSPEVCGTIAREEKTPGQVRPRQGTEICNFGAPSPLEALHWIFCFFSSIYVQFSKTSPLKSGETSEKSSGEFASNPVTSVAVMVFSALKTA